MRQRPGRHIIKGVISKSFLGAEHGFNQTVLRLLQWHKVTVKCRIIVVTILPVTAQLIHLNMMTLQYLKQRLHPADIRRFS